MKRIVAVSVAVTAFVLKRVQKFVFKGLASTPPSN